MSTTKLFAVQRMFDALQEPRPTTIPGTNDGSLEGDAEIILDEVIPDILRRSGTGWVQNRRKDVVLPPPNFKLVVSSVSGTWIQYEEVTQAVSLAEGTLCYIDTDFYLEVSSGTFVTGQTITGTLSAATYAVDTVTALSGDQKIAYDKTLWLSFVPKRAGVVRRGTQYLFDIPNNTNLFGDSETMSKVLIDMVATGSILDITDDLMDYIIAEASVRLQRGKKRGRVDEAVLNDGLRKARASAFREDSAMSDSNILNTREQIARRGDRELR